MPGKTNKSFSKRLKITRTGKLSARRPGYNHFNAKQSRAKQLGGKRMKTIILTPKVVTNNLPFNKVSNG